MAKFNHKFKQTLAIRDSALCVGLDPEIERLPSHLPASLEGLTSFCQEIISATAGHAAAIKLNFAFFEAHGHAGWRALEQVVAMIPEEVITIADAKRGDIGNTARLYARAIFHELGFDAMTANAYLGADAAAPFLEDEGKGVFFLCRTSNPGGKAIQWYPITGSSFEPSAPRPLFGFVAEQVAAWNAKGNAALVVGATHPQELETVRELCPDLPFLIPGIGAQGGDLQAAARFGVTAAGNLAVISASRSIIYASRGRDFASKAAEAAESLRSQIRAAIREA